MMPTPENQPQLVRIQLFPIKSLDPIVVREARIGPSGRLELDRAWALHSVEGRWIRGKNAPAIHLIRAEFAPDLTAVTLSSEAPERPMSSVRLAFPADTEAASAWFSRYFQAPVRVFYAADGFPDHGHIPGPTIVSTASLEKVCEWFRGVSLDEARRRFRANLEITGVPAFWEDRLFDSDERACVRFRVGDVAFEGAAPCERCVVPSRDPRTGVSIDGFQKRFTELRQAHLPPWSPASRFDHFYYLAVNTRVHSAECGKLLRLGDALEFA
jgi:uncharacterized protein YcbX